MINYCERRIDDLLRRNEKMMLNDKQKEADNKKENSTVKRDQYERSKNDSF